VLMLRSTKPDGTREIMSLASSQCKLSKHKNGTTPNFIVGDQAFNTNPSAIPRQRIMAGTKRKEAPRSHRPSSNVQAKKPKIEVPSGKKSPQKPLNIQPAAKSDDAEESETTESNGFSGFSEDDQTGTSSVEEVEGKNIGAKVTDLKPANGATKTAEPTIATHGASNCMKLISYHARVYVD